MDNFESRMWGPMTCASNKLPCSLRESMSIENIVILACNKICMPDRELTVDQFNQQSARIRIRDRVGRGRGFRMVGRVHVCGNGRIDVSGRKMSSIAYLLRDVYATMPM